MNENFFTEEDKIKFFDEIAEHFYERNFGTFAKADMELLMFRFYPEKLTDANMREDGTIDYSKCSDYNISKELGITQQRVRNLKVKKQLVYPTDVEWEKSLANLTKNARYLTGQSVVEVACTSDESVQGQMNGFRNFLLQRCSCVSCKSLTCVVS
ncbi:MAG: hypothetical protein LIO92_02995 [Clostridiales bacterium]|nr:hypothetical protein [Clostridiales bacterium]